MTSCSYRAREPLQFEQLLPAAHRDAREFRPSIGEWTHHPARFEVPSAANLLLVATDPSPWLPRLDATIREMLLYLPASAVCVEASHSPAKSRQSLQSRPAKWSTA